MKKYFLFLTALTLTLAAKAQVTAAYDVGNTVGTYQEISDGTVITADASETVPIGFDFKFDNQYMNRLLVRPGYVKLCKDSETASIQSSDNYYVFTNSGDNDIAGLATINGIGIIDGTEVSYKVLGQAPQRVFVLQYKNLGANTARWDDNYIPVQLQLRFNETSGIIEMVFKDWYYASMSSCAMRLGIKGNSEDALMLTDSFSGVSTSTNTAHTLSWSSSDYPVDGQTYTLTPPDDCESPASQPTGLSLTPTSTQITGGFTKSASADHYLVLLSESATLTEMPTDGTNYATGDKLGAATVITYTDGDTFSSSSNLSGATQYHIFVFAANSACMFGPKYQTASPLTAAIGTNPDGPQALSIVDTGLTEATLNVTANTVGDNLFIAVTNEPLYNDYGQMLDDGMFGTPTADLQVGDEIEGGGKVVYIGPAMNGIHITGLSENKATYFQAWSVSDGQFSTTYATANTSTGGTVPWSPDFQSMSPYSAPPGWDCTQYWSLASDSNVGQTVLRARVTTGNAMDGVVSEAISPWIQLAQGSNRVLMDINLTQYSMRQTLVYNDWADDDVITISLTTDGSTFTTIHEITKENAPKLQSTTSYATQYIPFDIYGGHKVKMRISWETHNTATPVILSIKDLAIEEIGDCDYPINLAATSVVSDKATIDWQSQGNETAWQIRWRVAGNEEWGQPIAVSSKPYTVSGLPSTSDIELQVRAACDATSSSEWSKALSFRSGYSLPFTEGFSSSTLPDGWELRSGALATPTEFADSEYWGWYNSYYLSGLLFMPNGTRAYDEWVITPQFDMGDGSVNYELTFKLDQIYAGNATDDTYSIVVSRDGGNTFNASDVVASFTGADINNGKAEFSARLSGYSGTVRAALYIQASAEPSTLQMTEVSVTETCPTDIADIEISDITESSAKVSWSTASATSLVFIRKAGDTAKLYQETEQTYMLFENLEPRTDYEIGITKQCAEDDIAPVTIVTFTTLADDACPQVENVQATAGKYDAQISWSGETLSYNVRYRKADDNEYTIVSTSENSITLTGLDCDTEYFYGIQSKCSSLDEDVSEYTADASFRTLTETCFPPTNVSVEPSYNSTLVSWTGDNDDYELRYAADGDEEWITVDVTGSSYTIENLEAETSYRVSLRTICSATDASLWTAEIAFTTEALPECVTPSDLQVSSLTANTALLSWTADESNLRWNIHYRKGTDSAWTEIDGITETGYELTGLEENTPYVWSVMAECEAQNSGYAGQNKFSTTVSGISDIGISDTEIFVKDCILNIVNPDHGYIESVTLYSTGGMLINRFAVETTENVFIPLNGINEQVVLIVITGSDSSKTIKVSL